MLISSPQCRSSSTHGGRPARGEGPEQREARPEQSGSRDAIGLGAMGSPVGIGQKAGECAAIARA